MEILRPEMSATETVTRKHGDKDGNKRLDNIYIYIYTYIHIYIPISTHIHICTHIN